MCKNCNGSHSGGSSFVNVNDCWLIQKLFVYHRYKFSFKIYIYIYIYMKSQYMVSHSETGSDSPIGSDRDRGRDRKCIHIYIDFFFFCIWIGNESEDRISPYLVQIHQSSRVRYRATIGILYVNFVMTVDILKIMMVEKLLSDFEASME